MLKLDEIKTNEIINVGLRGIRDGHDGQKRLRKLNKEAVEKIAKSFKETGQLNPVILRNVMPCGYEIVAGLHRVYAARHLGWETIQAFIIAETGDEKLTHLNMREIEIRENLDRFDLSEAELRLNLAELTSVKQGQVEIRAGNPTGANQHTGKGKGRNSPQNVGNLSTGKAKGRKTGAAVKAAAEESGESVGKVERSVKTASEVKRLDEVAHTSLDTSGELDALAKLPEAVQDELIDKAIAGEDVSARDVLNAPAKIEPAQKTTAQKTTAPKKPTKEEIDHEEAVNATWDWCEAMQAAGIPLATVITWCEAILKTRNSKKYLEGMKTEMHNRLQRKAAAE